MASEKVLTKSILEQKSQKSDKIYDKIYVEKVFLSGGSELPLDNFLKQQIFSPYLFSVNVYVCPFVYLEIGDLWIAKFSSSFLIFKYT